MDFLNKLSNMASETYKKTSKKTGELAQEAKIRMQMNEDKGKINDLYEEIGKIAYQKYVDGSDLSMKEDVGEYCSQIDELNEKIADAQQKVLTLRGKRTCEQCHEEIDNTVKFCPSCGTEQPVLEVEEVEDAEVVEEVEEETKEDKATEAEAVEEEEKEEE